ncbi:MAG: glycoside hydrolase family 88 protein [Chitinophagaceae bacterium]|nr:glycoside hydrolase family 88 protein [Chitinophagaceae bacterium]
MSRVFVFLAALQLIVCGAYSQPKVDVDAQLKLAMQQYELMLAEHPDTKKFPQSIWPDGSLRDMSSDWWTSGFFGATLWYLHRYSNDPKWKDAAQKWTMAVEKEQYNTTTHDLGFMVFYPFANGYYQTGDENYKKILLQGANSLSTRFDPARGVIKSWDKFQNFEYPVIVDNLMNLDYLTWATRVSGDKKYRNIAIKHADVTLKNHFRPDHSSYHVVCYGPNGEVEARKTHQGAADESAWARGQAWAVYGYTMMYRETKKKRYLKKAQAIADFLLSHPNLPSDKIPWWDFSRPGEERDASAGAIISSALFELSDYTKGKKKKTYFGAAEDMLVSLSSDAYRTKLGEIHNFMLKHSTGHKPGNSEIDVPLIYADYYYVEALLRYKAKNEKKKISFFHQQP